MAVKERSRGLSCGQLLMVMTSAQLAGQDFMVELGRRRADTTGQALGPVPTPASTPAYEIAKRFGAEQLVGSKPASTVCMPPATAGLPLRRTPLIGSPCIVAVPQLALLLSANLGSRHAQQASALPTMSFSPP